VALLWLAPVLFFAAITAPETPEQLRAEQRALVVGEVKYPEGDPQKTTTVIAAPGQMDGIKREL
jgi:hypothetical protein